MCYPGICVEVKNMLTATRKTLCYQLQALALVYFQLHKIVYTRNKGFKVVFTSILRGL
jgi:hypothetical protein